MNLLKHRLCLGLVVEVEAEEVVEVLTIDLHGCKDKVGVTKHRGLLGYKQVQMVEVVEVVWRSG